MPIAMFEVCTCMCARSESCVVTLYIPYVKAGPRPYWPFCDSRRMIFMKKALMRLLGWFSRINRVSHVHEETTYAFMIKPSALSQTGIRLSTCMVIMIDNVM